MVWYTCAHIRKFIHTFNYKKLDFNDVFENRFKPMDEDKNKILNRLYQCMFFKVQLINDCLPQLYSLIVSGNSQLIDWIRNAYSIKEIRTEFAIKAAVQSGDLELMQWLFNNTLDGNIQELMDDAAEYGHVCILDWLYTETGINITNSQYAQVEYGIEGAIRNGHLHVLQWLHAHGILFKKYTLAIAAEHGHYEIVKWLRTHGEKGCAVNAMYYAAYNGYIDIVIWLHQNCVEQWSIYAYIAAIKNNHLQVVAYLVTNVIVALEYNDYELLIKTANDYNSTRVKIWLENYCQSNIKISHTLNTTL